LICVSVVVVTGLIIYYKIREKQMRLKDEEKKRRDKEREYGKLIE
jgi:hypothetical protein